MAQLFGFGSTLFATETETTSNEINTTTNALQRYIGVQFPAQGALQGRTLIGYIWGEARDNLTNWQPFDTLPVIYPMRAMITLPSDLVGCVWRLRWIPLQSTPPGNGNFVYYRMQ